MFKTVLVPLLGQGGDKEVLETAREIMLDNGGHLDCLYVHDDAAAIIACIQTDAMGVPVASPELIDALNQEAKAQKNQARQTFDHFCQIQGIAGQDTPKADRLSASWRHASADVASAISHNARYSDAAILKRTPKPFETSLSDLGRIAMGSGRPVLVFPEAWRPRPIRHVAIAWKDTAEAARAVSAAIPVMLQARQIVLLSASEDSELKDTKKSAHACAAFLRWHGLDPEVRCLESDKEDAKALVFAEAAGVGADLVVMGAYGHSRLRELAFGGFTRRVLSESDLPVMLVH